MYTFIERKNDDSLIMCIVGN